MMKRPQQMPFSSPSSMLQDFELTLPTISGIASYPPGASFGPRRMGEFEFVWMIEGDAEYRWGDRTVAAPAGAIVLCRPGAVDFFRWDTQHRTRHGFFHFNLSGYPSHWPSPKDWPFVRLQEEGDILQPLFRYLLTWIGRGDPLQCKLTIANLLTAFLSGETTAGEVPHETWPQAVERAWDHIRDRLEEDPAADLDLAELARVSCVTPEHLCRLFKSATGRSPVETVRLARLDRAAVLLARSNYSIKEIAEFCGFSSPFHFSRRFKDAYGHSPSELRRNVQTGMTPPTPRLIRMASHYSGQS